MYSPTTPDKVRTCCIACNPEHKSHRQDVTRLPAREQRLQGVHPSPPLTHPCGAPCCSQAVSCLSQQDRHRSATVCGNCAELSARHYSLHFIQLQRSVAIQIWWSAGSALAAAAPCFLLSGVSSGGAQPLVTRLCMLSRLLEPSHTCTIPSRAHHIRRMLHLQP